MVLGGLVRRKGAGGMFNIYRRIRGFWDINPAAVRINLSPDDPRYFIDFDTFYEQNCPYLLPFLNIEGMQDKQVLEIGIGMGFILNRIANVTRMQLGWTSLETLRLNQKRGSRLGQTPNLVQATATGIPLKDNSLDAVISIGCLHHIPEPPSAAGVQVKRSNPTMVVPFQRIQSMTKGSVPVRSVA